MIREDMTNIVHHHKIHVDSFDKDYHQGNKHSHVSKHRAMDISALSSTPTAEQWRSKLGTSYPKDYMRENEARLLNELKALRDLPDNSICADCGVKGTLWASVNLGVFLCMTCGAHHRSLGTHISVPKGCTGTYFWGPDEIEQMKALGNARAQQLYGSESPDGVTKDDPRRWKEYLMDKYVHRRYAPTSRSATSNSSSWGDEASLLPSANKFSPRSKNISKQSIPDTDLIHFESSGSSPRFPKGDIQSPSRQRFTTTVRTGSDFFSEFGL